MRIFVSYAHDDHAVVGELRRDLLEFGGDVWLDESLEGGDVWWNVILRRIRDCELFVFVLSEQSLASEACRFEADYALDLRRPFLAIQVGGVEHVRIPDRVRARQIIRYEGYEHAMGLRSLVRALRTAEPPAALPTPLPPEPPTPRTYREHFPAIFGEHLSLDEQFANLGRLRVDLDISAKAINARKILVHFRDRPDIAVQVAREIDVLLEATQTTDRSSSPDEPAAGWFPDPTRRFDHRYWNGKEWTAHVGRAGRKEHDATPLPIPDRPTSPTQTSTGRLRILRERAGVNAVAAYGVWLDGEPTVHRLRGGEMVETVRPIGDLMMTIKPVGVLAGGDKGVELPVTIHGGKITVVRFVAGLGGARLRANEIL